MFLKETKSILTAAMQATFTPTYPVTDFQNLYISIEFPLEEQNYPAMWVGFEPLGQIERGGIDNEYKGTMTNPDGTVSTFSLWRATGYGTFTIGAMTAGQRDRLFDEVVRVFAFSAESQVTPFRGLIEENPLIAMNMNFDQVAVRGMSENPGTPWGTSEILYEATLAVEAVIEFASDQAANLTPLSKVLVDPTDIKDQITWPPLTVPQPWMSNLNPNEFQ